MIIGPSQIEIIKRGHALGFAVKYNSTTDVTIAAGTFETNGRIYTLSADNTHAMTSLAAGFDLHYIYLDESASAPTAPAFYDETTEPVEDIAKSGWYHPTNTEDRLVGAAASPGGSATIGYFDIVELNGGRSVRYFSGRALLGQLSLNMNPSGAWQTPNSQESDVIIPVSAKEIYLQLTNTNATAVLALYGASKEWADVNSVLADAPLSGWAYNNMAISEWIPLAASRKIRIAGLDTDDNTLNSWVSGFSYVR